MNKNTQILKALDTQERTHGLYEIEKNKVPLWRVVRFKYRVEKLKSETGFSNKTVGLREKKSVLILFFFKSIFQYFKQLLFGKKVSNVILAFPRLSKVDDLFVDKFTDPVIDYSDLKEDYIILQHSFGNIHATNRYHKEKIVYMDFVDIFARVFSILGKYYYLIKYKQTLKELQQKILEVYSNTSYLPKDIAKDIAVFKISELFYIPLLKKIKPRNLFLVNRETFRFVINICKRKKIQLFEFQHGITLAETPLYTGPYQEGFDPDCFLVFGEAWRNEYFGMPLEKIVNVGWAYSGFVADKMTSKEVENNETFLIISSPSITQYLIDFVVDAKKYNSKLCFDFRLHPQEKMTHNQMELINSLEGVRVVDNSQDSIFSIVQYNMVIGDNSSVIYEALSLQKRVGKLNMYQIISRDLEKDKANGFYVVDKFEVLDEMLLAGLKNDKVENNNSFYSSFKKDVFNALLK